MLARHGWMTSNELARGLKTSVHEVVHELGQSANRSRVLEVSAPDPGSTRIYHAVTPETSELPCCFNLLSLPWRLKCSAVEKLDGLCLAGDTASTIPVWARAFMACEQHIVGLGLYARRCRPGDGFPYPCAWGLNCHSEEVGMRQFEGGFRFGTIFSGTVPVEVDPSELQYVLLNTRRGTFRLAHSPGRTILTLSGMMQIQVDACTLEIASAPTRHELVADVKWRLGGEAERRKSIEPFLPIQPAKFALISAQETQGG